MKNKNIIKTISAVLCAVIVAVVIFICGFFGGRMSMGSTVNSYRWATELILNNYVGGEVTEEQLNNASLKALGSLLDKYSTYYTAEEYAAEVASNAGNMKGIGVSISYIPEGKSQLGSGIHVENVVGNSPAAASGLKAGTFVRGARYDGQITEFYSTSDFTAFVSSVAEGQPFTLLTDRGEYTVSREAYTASYCTMSTSTVDYSVTYDDGKISIVEKEGGISSLPDGAAYLKLSEFYGNAVNEFAELVKRFNACGCTSLILDLRGNGGGYVDVMCGISGIFLGQYENSNSVAMRAIYKDGSASDYKVEKIASSATLSTEVEVKILADNGTASASEALIGVLVSNGVADYEDIYITDFSDDYLAFSGTTEKDCRTYGKGIMQQTFVNPLTGEALKLTVAKIYWPNGTCIHDVGITQADGCNILPSYWSVTYSDEELAAAIDAIYYGGN